VHTETRKGTQQALLISPKRFCLAILHPFRLKRKSDKKEWLIWVNNAEPPYNHYLTSFVGRTQFGLEIRLVYITTSSAERTKERKMTK
jgi:hypothetical protein